MRKAFGITDNEETRMWSWYSANSFDELTKPEATVQDTGLCQDQLLVIETRGSDGNWIRHSKK